MPKYFRAGTVCWYSETLVSSQTTSKRMMNNIDMFSGRRHWVMLARRKVLHVGIGQITKLMRFRAAMLCAELVGKIYLNQLDENVVCFCSTQDVKLNTIIGCVMLGHSIVN